MLSFTTQTGSSAKDEKDLANAKLDPVIKKVTIQLLQDYIALKAKENTGFLGKGFTFGSSLFQFATADRNITNATKYTIKLNSIDNPDAKESLLETQLALCHEGRTAAITTAVNFSEYCETAFAVSNYLNRVPELRGLTTHVKHYVQIKQNKITKAKELITEILKTSAKVNAAIKSDPDLFENLTNVELPSIRYDELVRSLAFMGDYTYIRDNIAETKRLFPANKFEYPDKKTIYTDPQVDYELPFILQPNWLEHYLKKYRKDIDVNKTMVVQFEKKANPKGFELDKQVLDAKLTLSHLLSTGASQDSPAEKSEQTPVEPHTSGDADDANPDAHEGNHQSAAPNKKSNK